MNLRSTGNTAASKILMEVSTSPTRAKKYRQIIRKHPNIPTTTQLSTTEALSMFVEAELTRSQYNTIKNISKHIYPCYSIRQTAKKECYPHPAAFTITNTIAAVRLQELLDHTSIRLCQYLADVLERFTDEDRGNMELTSKWGCDGSKQSQYKVKFENISDSDANIFQSSTVPIRLICNTDNKTKIIWQNPVPSSPRYCRPIRIRFISTLKIKFKR